MKRRELLVAGLVVALPRRTAAAQARSALHRLHTGDLGALAAIDATLGGEPWRCLLDSGANVAVVAPQVAQRRQLRVIATSRVATAGGVLNVDRVALPTVRVGEMTLAAREALVLDLAATLGEAAAQVEGLIGATALRDTVTRWDFAAGRVEWLDRPPEPAHGGAAVWPLRWDQGLPVVELRLGDRPPARFMFDSGNAGSLVVFAHHAAALGGIDSLPRLTMRELGGAVTVHHALLESLRAPGYAAREVPVAFEAGGGARRGAHFDRLAGSVGLALFAAGAVTLDGPGARLVVEQPGLPGEAPRLPGGFGFVLAPSLEVAAVFDGSPAARAGVTPGRALRALDGAAVAGASPGDIWRALHGRERAEFDFAGLAGTGVTLERERFFARWA
jgi:hypothetical protein